MSTTESAGPHAVQWRTPQHGGGPMRWVVRTACGHVVKGVRDITQRPSSTITCPSCRKALQQHAT